MYLNSRQFKTLLLIHAADCDYEFHPNEREIILNQCTKQEYDKMIEIYKNEKAASFNYLIKEYNRRFPDQASKEGLKKELIRLFYADNNFSKFEKEFLSFFERLQITA